MAGCMPAGARWVMQGTDAASDASLPTHCSPPGPMEERMPSILGKATPASPWDNGGVVAVGHGTQHAVAQAAAGRPQGDAGGVGRAEEGEAVEVVKAGGHDGARVGGQHVVAGGRVAEAGGDDDGDVLSDGLVQPALQRLLDPLVVVRAEAVG